MTRKPDWLRWKSRTNVLTLYRFSSPDNPIATTTYIQTHTRNTFSMASTPTAAIGNEAPVENTLPLSNAAIDDILARIEKSDAGDTSCELKRSALARALLH
jgi:hypothetical protein